MTTLTIRIPDKMRRELKSLSKAENKAVSDIVRESIRRHVAVERFRALRKTVLPYAEAQGILTDEDVFRALK
jgi:predicted transcriptional regulator